jgi:hypothetical protein
VLVKDVEVDPQVRAMAGRVLERALPDLDLGVVRASSGSLTNAS